VSYDDKVMSRPPAGLTPDPVPFDTAAHMGPDPAWSVPEQLAWWSAASLVLALNASETCRRSAAAEGDKRAAIKRAALLAADTAERAEEIHAEHHDGYIVPSLDSCPDHDRASYEALVSQILTAGDPA
jgi:hypothetical protein